jgi:hypothetical protein
MDQFFTWEFLGTMGGCIVGTGIVTQLLKGVKFIEKIPTQLFSYLVALAILNGSAVFMGTWDASFAGLSLLNAILIALSSNGGYEAAKNLVATVKGLFGLKKAE